MFQFCTAKESDIQSIIEDGFILSEKLEWHENLTTSNDHAKATGSTSLLVRSAEDIAKSPIISEMDFMNLNPRVEISAIAASGGFLVRQTKNLNLEILLIYRRGHWDLPKGKVDPGESIEEAGKREVEEEVGSEDTKILKRLKDSHHTYPHKGKLVFKTTSWFVMTCSNEEFTPQAEEDIQKAEWREWDEAKEILGYASLREHMAEIDKEMVIQILHDLTEHSAR